MVSRLFSRCNFYAMLIWLVNLILIVYQMTSYLITTPGDKVKSQDIEMSLAYAFLGLQHLIFVYNINSASEHQKTLVQDLKMTIKQTNFKEDTIAWNGNLEPTSVVKDFIIENLDEFQGFDAEGYFTLGKSFLSSVVTNFLTYLIILIQLKLTLITSFK